MPKTKEKQLPYTDSERKAISKAMSILGKRNGAKGGRIGGRSRSALKVKTAVANGRLGGRPRGAKNKTKRKSGAKAAPDLSFISKACVEGNHVHCHDVTCQCEKCEHAFNQ